MRPRIRLALLTSLFLIPALAGAEQVTFTYVPVEGEEVKSVSVRGSLNNWGETDLELQPDGSWAITIPLDPGEVRYKYFINGQWPKNMETERDGGPIDADTEGYVDDDHGGQNAVRNIGGDGAPASAKAKPVEKRDLAPAPELVDGYARIHYHRPDGQYGGWGLHLWEDTPESVEWGSPWQSAGEDEYGIYWDFRLNDGASKIGFIVHKGDQKDPGPDMTLLIGDHGCEVWLASGSATIFTEVPDLGTLDLGDLSRQRAFWVAAASIAWPVSPGEGDIVRLHFAPDGGLELTKEEITGGESFELAADENGLSKETRAKFPHLAGHKVFSIPQKSVGRAAELLKGALAVSITDESGQLQDATGIQIPGVLDDLFTYDGPLGIEWNDGIPTIRVWAPTARRVDLLLFENTAQTEAKQTVAMTESNGVWSAKGNASWKGMQYLYDLEVYVPSLGEISHHTATDPYSRGLSMNSLRSLVVDLADPDLAPPGWNDLAKPALEAPNDITLYELHIRDFSAFDPEVPEGLRGTFEAFTVESNGSRHLRAIADAGLSHLHLLPAFDIATIEENRSLQAQPGDLSGRPADSEWQQKRVSAMSGQDGFNWGYDPFHYGVPEGSYSTDPDGTARIYEFRRMVQSLADLGLRVVMDVVYNHTNASGLSEKSVLDRVVPGYYHRLNADGIVESSTCCQNTATEHAMMERLMIDDLIHWARDYKVDGFRFDLMGHHMKRNMVAAAESLHALTPEHDGVDGSSIYLYGEGWDFGEVAGGARGANASQLPMAGTGIGTFNDRMRDAVRGGNPFSDRGDQGFATSSWSKGSRGSMEAVDRIRIGLTGNLRDFKFVASNGQPIKGGDMSYAGYTSEPHESINYISAHDNETFWDKIAYSVSDEIGLDDRVRMQNMAVSLVALGQGVPFFHAGVDMLRSKSMDADSYNSGDWFNRLDFTYESNNFGVGLPVAAKNFDRWDVIRPKLTDEKNMPGKEQILRAVNHFREMLMIRKSSPLFRLRSADEMGARLFFHNTGRDQIPGLIVMSISDNAGNLPSLDDQWRQIWVLFNATGEEQCFDAEGRVPGRDLVLHPVLRDSHDSVVRGAHYNKENETICVPARTTTVFVSKN